MAGYSYSFLDVQASIAGPGGNFPLSGDRVGIAQEGITVTATGDKNVMTIGADGAAMHSLSADQSGTIMCSFGDQFLEFFVYFGDQTSV